MACQLYRATTDVNLKTNYALGHPNQESLKDPPARADVPEGEEDGISMLTSTCHVTFHLVHALGGKSSKGACEKHLLILTELILFFNL
jgi:hypothetical protein